MKRLAAMILSAALLLMMSIVPASAESVDIWDVEVGKIMRLENGTMIDPELAVRDRAMWGYFCTWSGEFVMTDGIRKSYSEQYTDIEMLTKVYNSEYVITRDELPDLHSYPIRDDAK